MARSALLYVEVRRLPDSWAATQGESPPWRALVRVACVPLAQRSVPRGYARRLDGDTALSPARRMEIRARAVAQIIGLLDELWQSHPFSALPSRADYQ